MKRREFMKAGFAAAACPALVAQPQESAGQSDQVMTVTGLISPAQMGRVLTHEHVLVDFAGAATTDPAAYDLDEAFQVVLPHLRRIRELGCDTFVDCTPAYIGRSPRLLARLAAATGIRILTNTGYYGAADDKYLPSHAFTESASELAARWIAEWRDGIEGTGIRPGFIKIGVDSGPLSDIDRKLVQAAARTHLRTGLTIMSHTGPQVPAFEQLAVLAEERVEAGAWIWTHAQNEEDGSALLRAAEQGAWVALDGVNTDRIEFYLSRLEAFRDRGLLGRVLLSHDAGWYSPGEPGGGGFRGYEALFTHLLPAMEKAGFTPAEIQRVLVKNPAEAFTLRRRPADG